MKRPLDKDLKLTIEKRNRRLLSFFELLNMEVDIIGDMETPAIVKDNLCLSCYVHNFNLIFTTHYEKGVELYRVKLQKDQEVDAAQVEQWLQTAEHRIIYKIKLINQPLYLCGYSFKNKNNPEEKYPVFGKFAPKVYFTKDYAAELIDLYKLDYCEVV